MVGKKDKRKCEKDTSRCKRNCKDTNKGWAIRAGQNKGIRKGIRVDTNKGWASAKVTISIKVTHSKAKGIKSKGNG